jgi:PAS domain S-box-containing protein
VPIVGFAEVSAPKRYVAAFLLAATALALRQLLSPFFGSNFPFLLSLIAVILSVRYCGTGPSVLSSIASVFGVWYWFLPFHNSFRLADPRSGISTVIAFSLLSGLLIAASDTDRRRRASMQREIGERLRVEQELRKTEERLRLSHRASHSGAWEVDMKTRAILCSPEFHELWGIPQGSPDDVRAAIRRMILPEDYPIVDSTLTRVLQDPSAEYHLEYRMRAKDGAVRWMESFGEVICDDAGAALRIVGVTTDVTRRKEAEEALRKSHLELEQKVHERTRDLASSLSELEAQVALRQETEDALRDLSARLLRLQDEERRRVARELHDSTGQTLAAMKMTAAAIRRQITATPETAGLFDDLTGLLDQAVQEIRTTSYLLHPPMLDEVGFASAARWYVDGFAKRSGIVANLSICGETPIGKDAELVFFRVLQESLTNVLRHSCSKAVDIQFAANHLGATLSIRDYGRGIPPGKLAEFEQTGSGMGVGLAGMRQRVRELRGQLHVASSSSGTCVSVTLPLDQSAAQASA